MGELITARFGWNTLRSVSSADWPTHTNSYDPSATVTHRLASRMLTHLEADLEKINCILAPAWNALEIRARLSGAAATSTFHILGRRGSDASVKLFAWVVATAGSQTDGTNYHATTLTVTSYWPKTITMSNEPTGSGMCTLSFDTMGWSEFWIGVTALSAGTIYFDYAGF
jgi:hypothetical protein